MRYTQPQSGSSSIDKGDSLSLGLAFLINAGASTQPFDFVGNRKLAVGSADRNSSSKGYAYSTAQSAAGARLTGNTALTTSDGAFSGDFSISVYANPPVSGSSISIPYAQAASAVPESYVLFNGNYSAGQMSGAFAFSISNGGTGTCGQTAANAVDGAWHVFTVIRRGTTFEMWRDGVLLPSVYGVTGTASMAIGATTRPDVLLGYFSGGYGCPFGVEGIIAHNRALSSAEVRRLGVNPWAIFKSAPRKLWASSTPASITVALAWTEDSEAFSAAAVLTNRISASWTEASETQAITGVLTDSGALAWTEQSETMAITATAQQPTQSSIQAAMAWTEAGETASIVVRLINRAAIAIAEQGETWSMVLFAESPPRPDPSAYPRLNLYAIIGPARINLKSTMRDTGINLSSKLL